jgi:hypothetical protein
MEIAIQVVWWIGLAGALLLTVPILQTVVLVVRALRDIMKLGHWIQEAAEQLAADLDVGSELASLLPPAGRVQTEAEELSASAVRLGHAVAANLSGRGG